MKRKQPLEYSLDTSYSCTKSYHCSSAWEWEAATILSFLAFPGCWSQQIIQRQNDLFPIPSEFQIPKVRVLWQVWDAQNGSRQKTKNIIPYSTPIACHSCLHWPLFSVLYQELRPVPQPPLPLQSPTCPKVSANMEVSKNKQLTHDTYWKHLKTITFALDANVNAYGAKLD